MSITLISIDRQAVLRRVNRRLKASGEQMFRTRGQRAAQEVGEWFVANSKAVTGERLELEPVARKLGVLRPWERVDEEAHA
jgi:hypothetical protein